MNRELVKRIADAVLYEGYILYPYRPSVKNRQRWTFGGLLPAAYCQEHTGSETASNQTECLVQGGPATNVNVAIRCLHLTNRSVGEIDPPLADWPAEAEPVFRPVESLRLGGRLYHSWQEAEEREVAFGPIEIGALLGGSQERTFAFPGRRWLEPLRAPEGKIAGVLIREQHALDGRIEAHVTAVADSLFRVTVRIMNSTLLHDAGRQTRDAALLRALVSAHTILNIERGAFVSLLDPPVPWRELAGACHNAGTWPVLVGEAGACDTMLSSPIILYDYPQLAPESQGDLFDATEIDEILTLRILTLTDEEKQLAAAVDDRAASLLARTEALACEQLLGLHGTIRGLRPSAEEQVHG